MAWVSLAAQTDETANQGQIRAQPESGLPDLTDRILVGTGMEIHPKNQGVWISNSSCLVYEKANDYQLCDI
jgi:hypothetical protein